jgi:hypothetical protein
LIVPLEFAVEVMAEHSRGRFGPRNGLPEFKLGAKTVKKVRRWA